VPYELSQLSTLQREQGTLTPSKISFAKDTTSRARVSPGEELLCYDTEESTAFLEPSKYHLNAASFLQGT
jgi:hypothetical protein